MEKLKRHFDELIAALSKEDHENLMGRLDNLVSVYPFNEYEFIISTLLGLEKLSLDDYYLIRDEYLDRNMFLYIFEISAPRGFGEQWAQGHLKELVPELHRPNKNLDPDYSGQYDFILTTANGSQIRIEVKASRAVDFDLDAPLYAKALSSDSDKRFDMNFQQMKPTCCDVFVWIAVWRDLIKYWVLASKEVASNKSFSSQHRRSGSEEQVYEGQIHIKRDNIDDFNGFAAGSDQLKDAVFAAFERQKH